MSTPGLNQTLNKHVTSWMVITADHTVNDISELEIIS